MSAAASSTFGRKLFGGASTNGGASCGGFETFAKNYYAKYIKTSSITPVLHAMGLYSGVHWALVYKHKHSYQVNNRFH